MNICLYLLFLIYNLLYFWRPTIAFHFIYIWWFSLNILHTQKFWRNFYKTMHNINICIRSVYIYICVYICQIYIDYRLCLDTNVFLYVQQSKNILGKFRKAFSNQVFEKFFFETVFCCSAYYILCYYEGCSSFWYRYIWLFVIL